MSETQEDLNIDTVGDEPEEIGTVVSPDYTTRENTPPGKYASEFRTITLHSESVANLDEATRIAGGFKSNKVKVALFQVDLKGLVDRTTGKQYRRPDRTWISTRPTREKVYGKRDEYYPGTTSDVMKYLNACMYSKQDLQNLKGLEQIQSILDESQNRPVGVTTGLAPRGKKTGTLKANGKEFYRTPGNPAIGVYDNAKKLYTKAFADGDKWLTSITDADGEEWDAQETIERFHRLGA